jgi:hypothetical protein
MTLDPYLILILIPHLSSGCGAGTRCSFARQPHLSGTDIGPAEVSAADDDGSITACHHQLCQFGRSK